MLLIVLSVNPAFLSAHIRLGMIEHVERNHDMKTKMSTFISVYLYTSKITDFQSSRKCKKKKTFIGIFSHTINDINDYSSCMVRTTLDLNQCSVK